MTIYWGVSIVAFRDNEPLVYLHTAQRCTDVGCEAQEVYESGKLSLYHQLPIWENQKEMLKTCLGLLKD